MPFQLSASDCLRSLLQAGFTAEIHIRAGMRGFSRYQDYVINTMRACTELHVRPPQPFHIHFSHTIARHKPKPSRTSSESEPLVCRMSIPGLTDVTIAVTNICDATLLHLLSIAPIMHREIRIQAMSQDIDHLYSASYAAYNSAVNDQRNYTFAEPRNHSQNEIFAVLCLASYL